MIPVIALAVFSSMARAAETQSPAEWVTPQWDNLFAVVVAGAGEPQSTGSYSLRIYRNDRDAYINGLIEGRNGMIAGTWMTDLDKDNKPEILVWIRNAASGSYGELHVYTLEKDNLKRILLAEPKFDQVSGYRGHDTYHLEDGSMIRSFPRYQMTDTMAEPSGGTQRYRLDFPRRRWVSLAQ